MTKTVITAAITAALMALSIIIKPYITIKKFKVGLYCLISVAGAAILLAFGAVSVKEAVAGMVADSAVNPIKILALFLSVTLVSVYLGNAGFFSFVAERIFKNVKGGQIKLFLLLYATVAILTVFTSNDIIVLTFTPPVCIFARKAKISPVPYLMGEFVAANTWSVALIVGNPTNIYLAGSYGVDFFAYAKVMLLPAIVAGVSSLCVLLLLFGKQLKRPVAASEKNEIACGSDENAKTRIDKVQTAASLFTLCACIIALSVSSFIGAEMWLVCVVGAGALTAFLTVYGLIRDKSAARVLQGLKKEPYELIPFVLSMFVIVLALKKCGFTDVLGNALLRGGKSDALSFGFLSALSVNFLNNIPMSVLFEKIIGGKSLYALYGAVIGSNLGAFITPVGALAGIMWTKILNGEGVKLSFGKFALYGKCCALPAILLSCLTLFITL